MSASRRSGVALGLVYALALAGEAQAQPASVVLPSESGGAVVLADPGSGMRVRVRFLDAHGTLTPDGALAHAAAPLGPGTAMVVRRTRDGFEDYVGLARPRAALRYELTLEGVAGLRRAGARAPLELLDAGGAPRIRMAPPYLVDARGRRLDVQARIHGCALDVDARPPWGRPLVAPGRERCVLELALRADHYPVVVDPAWMTTGAMSTPRIWHAATLLADGRVLVTGGRAEEHTTATLASAEVFDPDTETWAAVADMTVARERHTGTRTGDGRVLVVGDATADLYDPLAGTFSAASAPTEPRQSHAAIALDDGRVLVTGGVSHPIVRASAELYDPGADRWTFAPSMRVERWDHSLDRLPDGRLIVVGGIRFVPDGTERVPTTELFDPAGETWALAGPLRTGRGAHATAILPTGDVVVVGGDGGWDETTFERYDPLRDRFTEGERAPGVGPAFARAVVLSSGVALFTGGERGSASASRLYLPWTHDFITGPSLTSGRTGHTSTRLDDDRVLVSGGVGGPTSGVQATAELLAFEAVGGSCEGAADCLSGVCEEGTCAATPALPEPPIDGGVGDGGGAGGVDAGARADAGASEGGGGCAVRAARPGDPLFVAFSIALAACARRRRRR